MRIKELVLRLRLDKEFAQRYAQLSGMDGILAQAKEDGFDISEEDVAAIQKELKDKKELTAEELTFVTGGISNELGDDLAEPNADCPIFGCGGKGLLYPDGSFFLCYSCHWFGRYSAEPIYLKFF